MSYHCLAFPMKCACTVKSKVGLCTALLVSSCMSVCSKALSFEQNDPDFPTIFHSLSSYIRANSSDASVFAHQIL
jgi:hypothetical protein